MEKSNILYLFSSNQLPRYERDALDTVCLPAGSIMQFRYGSDNIDPKIKNLLSQGKQEILNGQRVIVVFVNAKGKEDKNAIWQPEFFPLRSGKLVQCRQADDRTLFFFELTDEFINYEKYSKIELDKFIRNLSNKPLKSSSPGTFLSGIFAGIDIPLPLEALTRSSSAVSVEINTLMDLYPERMFYSFYIEKIGKNNNHEKVQMKRFSNRIDPLNGFELSSRGNYSLIFHYYFNPKSKMEFPEVSINIRDPRSVVTSDVGDILLGNRSDEREIKLYPIGVSSRSYDLRLEIAARDLNGKDLGRLSLPIFVKRNLSFLVWLVVIGVGLTIGSGFSSLYTHIGGSILSTIGIFFLAHTYKQ